MLKSIAMYAAMIAVAVGVQHVLVQFSRDADSPIIEIAKAQAAEPFGYQIPPAQLAAITTANARTIAADKSALAQAERGVAP